MDNVNITDMPSCTRKGMPCKGISFAFVFLFFLSIADRGKPYPYIPILFGYSNLVIGYYLFLVSCFLVIGNCLLVSASGGLNPDFQ